MMIPNKDVKRRLIKKLTKVWRAIYESIENFNKELEIYKSNLRKKEIIQLKLNNGTKAE